MSFFGLGMSQKDSTPAKVVFTDNAVDSATTSVYTFSSVNIGTAHPNRTLVIGAAGGASAATARTAVVKVNGTTMTQIVFDQSSNSVCGLWLLPFPTGTTATVEVTWSPATGGAGIGVFACYGLQSLTARSSGSTNSNAAPVNLTIPRNGVGIGYKMAIRSSGASPTYTWVNLTEKFDQTIVVNAYSHTGACDNFATSTVGLGVTATGVNVANSMQVCASFR